MNKITPFLWFDTQASEAASFYVSIFKNSRIIHTDYYGPGAPRPEGEVITVTFELDGQTITALNAGPEFKFTEAISFFVNCDSQAEVDELWAKLTADGGQEGQCGWLKDKFGLSWQIVPNGLSAALSNPDPEKARYAMQAMLKMHKIELKDLTPA